MKLKFFALSLLLCTVCSTGFAQKAKPLNPVSVTVQLTEVARALVVENDVTVILTNDGATDVIAEGEARDVKALRVRLNDGVLSLSSSTGSLAGVKVYVPAAQLSKISLFDKSLLRSAAVLQNRALKITVDGEGIVNLSSAGKVVIDGTEDFGFVKSH